MSLESGPRFAEVWCNPFHLFSKIVVDCKYYFPKDLKWKNSFTVPNALSWPALYYTMSQSFVNYDEMLYTMTHTTRATIHQGHYHTLLL